MARSDVWAIGFGLIPMWRVILTRSVPRNREQHRKTLPLDLSEADAPRLTRNAKRVGANPERIYVAIPYRALASGIEFDWDDENKKHIEAHKVAPAEFEQLLNNDPIDLNFELIDNEERYRSVGLTNGGRLLSVVWTIRDGKVRAITAFPVSVSDRKAFLEKPK